MLYLDNALDPEADKESRISRLANSLLLPDIYIGRCLRIINPASTRDLGVDRNFNGVVVDLPSINMEQRLGAASNLER